jgi:hypothetical protein
LSFGYQINSDSSLAIGLRRIVGEAPVPNGGGNCSGMCSNLSAAYYLRLNTIEVYLGYGAPNSLTTDPQAILKVIFYPEGQKGT